MAMNLLTNRRKKTRGGSVYFKDTGTANAGDTNVPVRQLSITPDSHVDEETSSQLNPAPARTRTTEFGVPPTVANPQLRRAAIGEAAGPQLPHPGKSDTKADGGLGDNMKGPGDALETMQARFTAAKSSRVWDTYVRKAEEEDKDLVEDWDRVIDVTLVFAALFSAISTGFVLESSKNLQPDQARASVLAIRSLTTAIQAGINASTVSTTGLEEDSFQPTLLTIWVNCLWFLSLGLSISVSLFAMLAKRWCYVFRSKRTGTSHERAMKRQKSWDAIEQWRIELVIEQLPTLMHIALMLFFFGLVVYLAEIHQATMIVTAALVGFTVALYFVLTVLPLWDKNCPMVTPFTRIMQATHWYLLECFKFLVIRARSYLQIISALSPASKLYEKLSKLGPRGFFGAARSAPKQIPRLINAGLTSLWKHLVEFITVMGPFAKHRDPFKDPEWVIKGRTDGGIGKTVPRPQPDESNRYAFYALAWILNNSTEWETVKEVLDHITSFPDVILDSFADSDQLHKLASTAVEHLSRLQHDPAEWRHTLHIHSSCARLIYLTTLPWLHKSTDTESKYYEIRLLSLRYRQLGSIDMSPKEVEKLVATIKEKMTKLSEPVAWLEDLAGRIVLGCTPEPGLKMCATLGRTLLNEKSSLHARRSDVEVYPTLWWIFLNTVMDCTDGSWPHNKYEDRTDGIAQVCSDSALTLTHFRDSRKRQESGPWLAVVGITGMLYAFVSYPDHENGPAKEINKDYFLELINFLRLTLRTQVTLDVDLFLGDLPVYHGTEIRLYQFDSLQYGIDALNSVLNSPVYTSCSFSSDLRTLHRDLRELKGLKDLLRPKENQDLNYSRILEVYRSKAQEENAASMFLTAGVLRTNTEESSLSREHAHFLATFLPDIVFGRCASDQPTLPAFPEGCIGMAPNTDRCIEASDTIAIWAWMPFSLTYAFQHDLKAKDPNYRRRDMLWETLESMGLLRNPFNSFGYHRAYSFFSSNYHAAENPAENGLREAYRAIGYCLYIKAGLLDRLYSLPAAGTHSPNVLEWSIALAKHVVQLLQFWDSAAFDSEEQTYIINSLAKLINTMLDASEHTTSLEAITSSQNPTTAIRGASTCATDARGQLEALIKAGVLPILARPFSPCSQPPANSAEEHAPDKSEWYNDLARTIEKLARTFPSVRAEPNFATAVDDALREYDKPEWVFNKPRETSSGIGGDNDKTACDANSGQVDFYSDLVSYYEVKALENVEEPSPMLELVKTLRDDMAAQYPPASPRVESPIDVRIDMPQEL